jgi:hypothetical protein
VRRRDPTGLQGEPNPPAETAEAKPAAQTQLPKPGTMEDPELDRPLPDMSKAASSGDENDLMPVQLLTRGQGHDDRSMIEIMLGVAPGGDSLTGYWRHTLADSHTTLGFALTGTTDLTGKGTSGLLTGVLHLAPESDPGQVGQASLYIQPYLSLDRSGANYGLSGTGTLSFDLGHSDKPVASMDLNAIVAFDSSVSTPYPTVRLAPAGLLGLGIDFTLRMRDAKGKPMVNIYPEAGVERWESSHSGDISGSTQYYAGIGVGTRVGSK